MQSWRSYLARPEGSLAAALQVHGQVRHALWVRVLSHQAVRCSSLEPRSQGAWTSQNVDWDQPLADG